MQFESILFPGMDPKRPLVISGPCSAETEEQVLQTAKLIAQTGVKIFRAGIWKPRTKPGGFEGVGSIGLPWLARVKKETGMYIATEVAIKSHVEEALDAGMDMLWIGARTSANPFAMQEIADTLEARKATIPILIKNPVNPDLELWIGAIERIYGAGIRRIGVIHRGFSSYDKKIYRNHPLWHLPIELHRRIPTIPIICDPSHIGGKRELIASLSQQAMDLNFDGLIIESHCNPDKAWSDATQQITPGRLQEILGQIVIRESSDSTGELTELRQQIDAIDSQLLELLGKRMRISREIGEFKRENSMPILQSSRYGEILEDRGNAGDMLDLSPEFTKELFEGIHSESIRQQMIVMNRPKEDSDRKSTES